MKLFSVVAFPKGEEVKAISNAQSVPSFTAKRSCSSADALAFCELHNWQIAEHGEKYDLYIEEEKGMI